MVTISDVIAETGMSQGAIYRYYNGLDEILADMLTKMRSEYNIINSFGGATAYALCQNDPEFVCGINIDGLLIGDHVGKVLKTPFLQISCENNATLETRTYLDHTKPVFKVLFRDMEHLGFSDLKFAIPIKKWSELCRPMSYTRIFAGAISNSLIHILRGLKTALSLRTAMR